MIEKVRFAVEPVPLGEREIGQRMRRSRVVVGLRRQRRLLVLHLRLDDEIEMAQRRGGVAVIALTRLNSIDTHGSCANQDSE